MSISFNFKGSALLRGFESRNRDWKPKIRDSVYNAEALIFIDILLKSYYYNHRLHKVNQKLKKVFKNYLLNKNVK